MIALRSLKPKTILIKKGMHTMKKTTFITTIALLCTLLIGCGNQNSNQDILTVEEFYTECEIDREEIKNISDKLDIIISNQTNITESIQTLTSEQEVPDVNVSTPTDNPSVTTEESTITVSVIYNKELLAVPISTNCDFSPFELTYPGHADRDLSIIVSGSISHINLVDEKGYYIATLSESYEINNLNYLYFYMDNDGMNGAKFYFEIVISDNEHYYFGVDYHR